jgi:hypothetical protein
MRSIACHAVLLSTLLLGACAPLAIHQSLPSAAREKVVSTEAVVPLRQSEIYVFVPSSQTSAAAGGGLLFALIDIGVNSVRTSNAEEAVKPLRDALVDFSFDDTLRNQLRHSLSKVSWLGLQQVRVVKEVSTDNMDHALADSKAGAVLFATTDYRLSNDGDMLAMSLNGSLFPNNESLKAMLDKDAADAEHKTALANSIYRNQFSFQTKLPGATSDRSRNIEAWSADKGKAMRDALTLGAHKLAAMLSYDLQRADAPAPAAAAGAAAPAPEHINRDGVAGDVELKDADGMLVRGANGTLQFLAMSPTAPATITSAASPAP